MQRRLLNLEAFRFGVAGTGVLAGTCFSLLICMFIEFLMDNVRIPKDMPPDLHFYFFYVIPGFAPLIALAMILATVTRAWSREIPARRNGLILDFMAYFGIPFVGVYFVTWLVYWWFRFA